MYRFVLLLTMLAITGCEATAVKNSDAIRTNIPLNKSIALPIDAPVAFYVDKSTPDKAVNFYGKLGEAAKLVTSGMFSGASELEANSQFLYLFKFKSVSRWNRISGGWKSEITTEVVDNQGKQLFNVTRYVTSRGGGPYDINAIFNSFAGAIKSSMTLFLNQQGAEKLTKSSLAYKEKPEPPLPIRELMKDLKPQSSGTGFFINGNGNIVTATHVVDGCLAIEVRHKGQTLPATIDRQSKLLDLAVLNSEFKKPVSAQLSDKKPTPTLGEQIFVTGFPLADILSDYPSLTVGNISSLGGLKGSLDHFQFSAPVQPGNSGGAVVDYSGHVVGVVSSSLNQKMLLEHAGTTSQNVNFGIDLRLLRKFLGKNNVHYKQGHGAKNFEKASANAVEYSNQILCYK